MKDIFIAEAMYGLAIALSRAPVKLRDDDLTPYIVTYMRKYIFNALTEDRTVPVPYTTIKNRQRRGLVTAIPKVVSNEKMIPDREVNLYDLKDEISSCIKDRFERSVVELRELGFTDEEVAEHLQCSRPKVTLARQAVYSRFSEKT